MGCAAFTSAETPAACRTAAAAACLAAKSASCITEAVKSWVEENASIAFAPKLKSNPP